MQQRVAIIDMGTNTFHLLIATLTRKGYEITYREKVPVKIGVGGINEGMLTEEGISRAVLAMKEFKKTLDEQGVTYVRAFGTSALRSAKNGGAVAARIEAETGIRAEIIDGACEADYIYKGVRAAMDLGKEKSLIIDIGGGSVEFIIGNNTNLFWSRSFEIGGQRLLEKFQKHDPILPEEVNQLNVYFSEQLTPLLEALREHNPKTLAGSSGTFDTLSDIYCSKNNLELQETPETPFSIDAFQPIFKDMLGKNREERLKIPGMIEMRVSMIVVACCLIDFILKSHRFENIRVSSYSLKEGVVYSLEAGG